MNASIKNFAKKAKKRLGTGFWEPIVKEREQYIRDNYTQNKEKIKEIYARRLMREIYANTATDTDGELYKKVCKVLNQDSYTLNPISQLIDHTKFDNMDIHAQQNYIIKLTDKYNEMRERYEKERASNISIQALS